VEDGLGNSGLSKARTTETEHVALLLDEAAGQELLDLAGIQFRASGKVEFMWSST
jgi:hypothetical protein